MPERKQQVGTMMAQNAVPRGQGVRTKSQSGGFLKLAMATCVLLIGLGSMGWVMRDKIKDILGYQNTEPQLPEVVESPPSAPMPGVDLAPNPLPPPDVKPAVEQVTIAPPVPAPTLIPTPVPSPLPTEQAPPKAVPVEPNSVAGTPAAPPRAMPVDNDPPVPEPKKVPLTQGIQTSRTQQSGMVASATSSPPSLVEVGRASGDPKLLPEVNTPTSVGNNARPVIKNVPPQCQPALEGLKAFLAAPTWKERLQFMQLPEQMERKAKIYYSSNTDGPVEVDEIQYLRHDEEPQVGRGMHVVFVLFSRVWDYGFPVMVEQTGTTARVDWLTFVEFKDDLLNKFLANYMDGPVRFHVGIRRTHYFEDDVPARDEMDAFEVTTPMENAHGFVFTPRSTPLARSMNSTISWDKEASWVIVELQWRREGSAKWIELTALPQLNWYSEGSGNAPESVAAPSSPLTKPAAP